MTTSSIARKSSWTYAKVSTLVMIAVLALVTTGMHLMMLGNLLGTFKAHVFPEEMIGFWIITTFATVLLTVLISRKVWRN